jgi:aspartyl aminopeptidase
VQLGVEVYGGVLFNSWLDRDLGLSGRIAVRGTDGVVEQLVHVNRAVLRIPQLAIHLDRDVNERGLQLNPQQHLVPMWALGSPEPDGFRRFIAKELEVDADAVVAWDVMLHDVTPAAVIGRDHDLISAPRLDNLCSCWAATNALVSAVDDNEPDLIAVVCLFDHEEVGSMSDRGASSEMLPAVLERIVLAAGGDRDAWHRALAASVCVSADNAHATNPNYAERHDPAHVIALNGGPAVKLNANQRYASDAANTAVWIDACERAGVPVQLYVHRSDLPCGSTIGPLTAARLGVTTVDVGAPQLAMHAARELMGADDAAYLWRGLAAFLA